MTRIIGGQEEKIVEFNLEDFNEDMRGAFDNLYRLYQKILIKDSNWHFFYEGDFTILRCGAGWVDAVRVYLMKNDIKHTQPKEWVEPWELTREMQDCFGPIFHSLSVLVMELFRRNRLLWYDKLITNSVDRVIHPFLNMATYLKYFNAEAGIQKGPFVKWEAEVMASLTVSRAHTAGMIIGEQRMKRIMTERREGKDGKETDKKGKDSIE